MAIVIKLERNADGDEDMVFENGVLQMSERGEACGVRIKERLLTDRTEAIASPLVNTKRRPIVGTGWEIIIFDNSKSDVEKELELKRAIFASPEVKKITYWSWQLSGRTLNLNFKIETDWGELAFGEEIQL
jgi:hypothetical protein